MSGPGGNGGHQLEGDLLRMAQGKPLNGGDPDDAAGAPDPQGKSYSAHDFTYDKTNRRAIRMPSLRGQFRVVRSRRPHRPVQHWRGILTNSPFDDVVGWYRSHLPAGWHDLTIGDLGQMSRALSPENIGKLLGQGAGGADASTSAPDGGAASAASDRVRISLFQPPAGSPNKTGVMIVQHGDQPVEALLQAKIGAP